VDTFGEHFASARLSGQQVRARGVTQTLMRVEATLTPPPVRQILDPVTFSVPAV
jgi:hypothetical protein